VTDYIETENMTAAQYLELPETNLPTELINGEVFRMPAPQLNHQDVVLQTALFLRQRMTNGKVYVAPVDVYLDEANVVQPDVLWIAPDNKRCVSVDGKYLRGAPDLIIEVFSPGTARRDKREKFRLYQKYGVREYWMVDPLEQFIEVWYLVEGKFSLLDVYGPGESFMSPLLGDVDVTSIFSATTA
jgi:Uma2 family endonuclease